MHHGPVQPVACEDGLLLSDAPEQPFAGKCRSATSGLGGAAQPMPTDLMFSPLGSINEIKMRRTVPVSRVLSKTNRAPELRKREHLRNARHHYVAERLGGAD